ncbi:MAG: hypothetical protein MUC29_09555 [Pyrinomonadaceae bacterium]|jgi:hypothetical protein|nr:hypothetical protein [Pyrinomonadaceae bacterium]
MKKIGLVIGIVLMILAGIGGIICLALPSLTNNKINFNEAIIGFIPASIVFILGLIITIISAIFLIKSNKK